MSQPPTTQATTCPLGMVDYMHDTDADFARWPLLIAKLRDWHRSSNPAFRRADGAALRHQRYHRRLVKPAAVCGTAAIVMAVGQLAFGEQIGLHVMAVGEFAAVVLAFVAFVLGTMAAFQTHWLVERNTGGAVADSPSSATSATPRSGRQSRRRGLRKRRRARSPGEADRGRGAQGRDELARQET